MVRLQNNRKITVVRDFSQSSFKLNRAILPHKISIRTK